MAGMHAEIIERAALATGSVDTLPVSRLGGIEITAVMETRDDFQDTADFTLAGDFKSTLGAWKEGHLRTAAHEAAARFHGIQNAPGRREIDTEGFFGEEILAGREHVQIELFVQIVRHGDIDDIDLGIGEQFLVVRGLLGAGGDAVKPRKRGRIQIRDRDENGAHSDVHEGAPAREGAGHFTAHEAAADDADADVFHFVTSLRAVFTLAPSCTIAIRARVMPLGFGCWMTLRPYTMPAAP